MIRLAQFVPTTRSGLGTNRLNPSPLPQAFVAFTVVGAASAMAPIAAWSQTVISAQSSSIAAAAQTITAMRVPVQVNGGTPSYFDVTITLRAVGGSTVTGISAKATSTPSVLLQTNGFVAGTYADSSGNVYQVSGPGVGPGGATSWTIAEVTEKGCGLFSATWYTDTGPNNPEYQRLQSAKIATTAYSFGVSGGSSGCGSSNIQSDYYNGALIGAQQSGQSISISSFSSTGYDYQNPVDTITYKLQGQ